IRFDRVALACPYDLRNITQFPRGHSRTSPPDLISVPHLVTVASMLAIRRSATVLTGPDKTSVIGRKEAFRAEFGQGLASQGRSLPCRLSNGYPISGPSALGKAPLPNCKGTVCFQHQLARRINHEP